MTFTKNEASQKMCPFSISNYGHGTNVARCMTDACLAWRWSGDISRQTFVPDKVNGVDDRGVAREPPRPNNVPESWVWNGDTQDGDPPQWVEPIESAASRRRGYCRRIDQPAGAMRL